MELIDRQALIDAIVNTPSEAAMFHSYNVLSSLAERQNEILNIVENAPAVDAVPVVHGRWIQPDFILTEFWKCTACGVEWYMEDDGGWNYCPNCGAKMDGEGSEGECLN